MTGALELLQQLFRTPPPVLLQALTTPGGLAQLSAAQDEARGRGRSESIVELLGVSSMGSVCVVTRDPCILWGCVVLC